MDSAKWQSLYICFMVGGLTIPIFDLLAGSIGGILSGSGDVNLDLDADVDGDLSIGGDADIDVDMNANIDLEPALPILFEPGEKKRRHIVINLMTLSFGAVVFGALGWFFIRRSTPLFAFFIALLGGLAGCYFLGHFILLPLKSNRPLAGSIRDVRGMDGIVKLELRSDFIGTIIVLSVTGSQVTYSACPMPGIDLIKTGTHVRVIRVDTKRQLCLVMPLE